MARRSTLWRTATPRSNPPARPPTATKWLTQNTDDFLAGMASAGVRLPPREIPPSRPIEQPRLNFTPRMEVKQPPPTNPEHEQGNQMTPEREALLRTLMTTPGSTILPWKGRQVPVADIIKDMLKGEEGAVVAKPQPTTQPGQTGPGVKPSQAAFDALSPAQYEELQKTGGLEGVTRGYDTRVNVRQGGAVEIRRSFDPDTGVVGPGRGMDLRDFDGPPKV